MSLPHTISRLAVAGLILGLFSSEPAGACDWGCRDARRPAPVYGYWALRAPAPQARLPTRSELRTVVPVPGGNTTLDPPGYMSAQGILESPIPSGRIPPLFGASGPVYGYSAMGNRPRRARRSP
jgi:hypothetical protein